MNFWLVLLSVMVLFACSDRVAGGGSSGSEAGNALTAQVVDSAGVPASGARVRLRPAGFVAGGTIDPHYDQTTDAQGKLRFEAVPEGEWSLEVQHGGDAMLRRISFADKDSIAALGADTLWPQASITGSIPTPFPTGTVVVIPGTEHASVPNPQGHFVLDSIPAGVLEMRTSGPVQSVDYRGTANPLPGQVLQVGPLAPESEYLLLEDFEDGDTRHRYSALADGEGWWFLDRHPDVLVDPSLQGFPVPLESDLEHGTVLHFKATMDSTSMNPWLDCGVQVGRITVTYDLRSVDSIVFWAKGSGSTILTLHYADSVSAEEPQFAIDLPAEWTRISVPTDSLAVSGVAGTREHHREIAFLSWVFIANAEFWLDDIMLIGATRSDIWP